MKKPDDVVPLNESSDVMAVPSMPVLDAWDEDIEEMVIDRLPFIRMIQPTTGEVGEGHRPGQIVNSLTGQALDSMRLLLLHMQPNRSFMPTFEEGSRNKPLCTSFNGVDPSGAGEEPRPGPCMVKVNGKWTASCPEAKWSGDDGRTPPNCSEQIKVMFWDLEMSAPVICVFQKTAIGAIKAIKSALKFRKMEFFDPEHPEIPINCFAVIEFTTAKQGRYFVPVLKLTSSNRPNWKMARDIAECTRSLKERLAIITEEVVNGQKPNPPTGDEIETEEGEPLPF